jgi:hypothetical protein
MYKRVGWFATWMALGVDLFRMDLVRVVRRNAARVGLRLWTAARNAMTVVGERQIRRMKMDFIVNICTQEQPRSDITAGLLWVRPCRCS